MCLDVFVILQTTCVLRYDGRGATGLFAVALVLEDHPSSHIRLGDSRTASPSNYLSQIPLQFVVQSKLTERAMSDFGVYNSGQLSAFNFNLRPHRIKAQCPFYELLVYPQIICSKPVEYNIICVTIQT